VLLLLLLFYRNWRGWRHLHRHNAAIWQRTRMQAAAQYLAKGGVHHADAVGKRGIVLIS